VKALMTTNLVKTILLATLCGTTACSTTTTPASGGLKLQVRAPQTADDNPFALPEAAFVVLAAEGSAQFVVKPYKPGLALNLTDLPFGPGKQVRVEVHTADANGQPTNVVIGRGISAPADIVAGGAPLTRTAYVTRTNRFAPPLTDADPVNPSTAQAVGAGQCAVTLPSGPVLFFGGAAAKAGAKNPYDPKSYDTFSNAAWGYDPDSRASVALGGTLTQARGFHSCAVGQSVVAIVGGYVLDPDSKLPVPSKTIEFFDMAAKPGDAQFRQTQDCGQGCTTGLMFARAGASVVRMFDDDNYFLILGGQGDTKCVEGQPCAANTWEVWHPLRGNLAQGLLNKPRWNHATARIPTSPSAGYVLLVGGENDQGPLADFEVLQFNLGQVSSANSPCPAAGKAVCSGLDDALWTPLTVAMPVARVLPGAVYLAGKNFFYVVIAGGFTDSAKTKADNTIDIFDINPKSGGGYKNDPGTLQMTMARGAPMISVVTAGSRAGQVLIAGGTTSAAKNDPPVDAEFLYFQDGTVNQGIIHPVENGLSDGARTLGNAVALPTGHVLIGGGIDPVSLAPRAALLLWNPY
jgi:hypothetical protein